MIEQVTLPRRRIGALQLYALEIPGNSDVELEAILKKKEYKDRVKTYLARFPFSGRRFDLYELPYFPQLPLEINDHIRSYIYPHSKNDISPEKRYSLPSHLPKRLLVCYKWFEHNKWTGRLEIDNHLFRGLKTDKNLKKEKYKKSHFFFSLTVKVQFNLIYVQWKDFDALTKTERELLLHDSKRLLDLYAVIEFSKFEAGFIHKFNAPADIAILEKIVKTLDGFYEDKPPPPSLRWYNF